MRDQYEALYNDNWQGKPDYLEKNLPQCHFINYKCHMDCSWIEPRLPQ
jgi:hypothetical protein